MGPGGVERWFVDSAIVTLEDFAVPQSEPRSRVDWC
jgi:hypothetical protein